MTAIIEDVLFDEFCGPAFGELLMMDDCAMGETHKGRGCDDAIRPDLVSYVMVSVPDITSLSCLVRPLTALVRAAAIRILDLVVLERGTDGAVDVHEIEAVDSLAELGALEGDVGGMLTDHDIELASYVLRLETCGVLVLVEERWAAPLSAALSEVGGRIIAGERIPPSRFADVLADQRRNGPG